MVGGGASRAFICFRANFSFACNNMLVCFNICGFGGFLVLVGFSLVLVWFGKTFARSFFVFSEGVM